MKPDAETIKRINNSHRAAMESAGLAQALLDNGDRILSAVILRDAFITEQSAARLCAQYSGPDVEPTRSILLRSAASLAIDCREHEEAAALISLGLDGQPPDEIRSELLELRATVERFAFSPDAQPPAGNPDSHHAPHHAPDSQVHDA